MLRETMVLKKNIIFNKIGPTAKVVVGVVAMLIFSSPAKADIYSFVDSRGVVHLTDRPTDSRYQLLMRTYSRGPSVRSTVPAPSRSTVSLSTKKDEDAYSPYARIITDAGKRYGIHRALIKAVIQAESSFNPLAVSRKGAVGLMQLMPATAKIYGVKNRLDPHANIHAGSQFLKDLLFRFNNNLTLSLAAYNAGEGAVRKYGNTVPPYPETREYVARVLQYYQQYRSAM